MNRAARRRLARQGVSPELFAALTNKREPVMYSHPSDPRIMFSESARARRLAVRLWAAAAAVAGVATGAVIYFL